jgi:hypothetical protein
LIIAGVALGLAARSLFPNAEIRGNGSPVDPGAQAYFEQAMRDLGEESP